jgi:ribosomal protein S18 acetylase RimI-like enzyme
MIHPDHRRNGLGSRLLRHIIEHAKTSGFSRITLLTDQVNSGAVRFYRRHGFQPSSMTALRLYVNV